MINSAGYILYEGLADAPTAAHYDADWSGLWAERLADVDNQLYVVAETERYPDSPELVGIARMQRNRPEMRMRAEYALVGATVEAAADTDTIDLPLVGAEYGAELMSLFINTEFQGMGIGGRLLQLVCRRVQEEWAAASAFCWCVDDESSRQFYLSKGGVAVGLKDRGVAYAFDLEHLVRESPRL